jgi:hypothetical protein
VGIFVEVFFMPFCEGRDEKIRWIMLLVVGGLFFFYC